MPLSGLFYLFPAVGDFNGIPILCTFTGVEFNCDPGLTTRVLTGVDALGKAVNGLTRWVAFICVGGWMLEQ